MEEVIAALLTRRNIEETARSVVISTKTLLRWLQVSEFDSAYRASHRLICKTRAVTVLFATAKVPGQKSASGRSRKGRRCFWKSSGEF